MSEAPASRPMTVEEYLEFEECAQTKHEYVRGQLFAMTGATDAHNIITGNLHAALHGFLQGSGCYVYMNDMKVRVETMNSFYYPDIMVTCEPFEATSVFKGSPSVIIEVLSPSTKQIDRREKLVAYKQLASLRQYVLVHQDKRLIESYARVVGDQWEHRLLHRTSELSLKALPDKMLVMPVSAVYADIIFPRVDEVDEDYEQA